VLMAIRKPDTAGGEVTRRYTLVPCRQLTFRHFCRPVFSSAETERLVRLVICRRFPVFATGQDRVMSAA